MKTNVSDGQGRNKWKTEGLFRKLEIFAFSLKKTVKEKAKLAIFANAQLQNGYFANFTSVKKGLLKKKLEGKRLALIKIKHF